MQMRRPYAHFKRQSPSPAPHPRALSLTHRGAVGGSHRVREVLLGWAPTMLTTCKTFHPTVSMFDMCSEKRLRALKRDVSCRNVLSAWRSLLIPTWNRESGCKAGVAYIGCPEVHGRAGKITALLQCFINAPPCAPVSESEGSARLWRLRVKTDLAPPGGGRAGNMWQLICANKHLWRGGGGSRKPPQGHATCTDLHCASDSEKPDKHKRLLNSAPESRKVGFVKFFPVFALSFQAKNAII